MKDFIQESDRDENRSIANQTIQNKSNEEDHFEDNSPEAIQMRKLQGNIDNSDESIQMNKLQTHIDNSDETKQLMAFDHAAQEHDTAQLQGKEEKLPNKKNTELPTNLQNTGDNNLEAEQTAVSNKPNNTGLPDDLKSNIESLSGYSLDDVKVHYNSDKPAELQAHAYAQGTDIYLGPGQEKHLPHEAWHVVQQMQGKVKPTVISENGVGVNDNKGLEKEANVMGLKMQQSTGESNSEETINTKSTLSRKAVQLKSIIEHDKLNVIGEHHKESGDRRDPEKLISKIYTKSGDYYEEQDFNIKTNEKESPKHGDLPYTRILIAARILHDTLSITTTPTKKELSDIIAPFNYEVNNAKAGVDTSALPDFEKTLGSKINTLLNEIQKITETISDNFSIENLTEKTKKLYESETELNDNSIITDFKHKERSTHMHKHANEFHNKSGIWKIGEKHIQDLDSQLDENTLYNKVSMGDFNDLVNELPAEALKSDESLKENQDAIMKNFLNEWWGTIDKESITHSLLKKATKLTDKNTLTEELKKVFPKELYDKSPIATHDDINNLIQFIATEYLELETKLRNDAEPFKKSQFYANTPAGKKENKFKSIYLKKGYIKFGITNYSDPMKGQNEIKAKIAPIEEKIKAHINKMIEISNKTEEKENIPK